MFMNEKPLRKKCMPIKTKYVQLQNFLTLVVENDTVISGINSVRKVKSINQIIVCFLRVKSKSNLLSMELSIQVNDKTIAITGIEVQNDFHGISNTFGRVGKTPEIPIEHLE